MQITITKILIYVLPLTPKVSFTLFCLSIVICIINNYNMVCIEMEPIKFKLCIHKFNNDICFQNNIIKIPLFYF